MSTDRKIEIKLYRNEKNEISKHVVLSIYHARTTNGDLKIKHRLVLDKNGIENRQSTAEEITEELNENFAKNYFENFVSVKNDDDKFVVIDKSDLLAAQHALTINVELPEFTDRAIFNVSNTRIVDGERVKSAHPL